MDEDLRARRDGSGRQPACASGFRCNAERWLPQRHMCATMSQRGLGVAPVGCCARAGTPACRCWMADFAWLAAGYAIDATVQQRAPGSAVARDFDAESSDESRRALPRAASRSWMRARRPVRGAHETIDPVPAICLAGEHAFAGNWRRDRASGYRALRSAGPRCLRTRSVRPSSPCAAPAYRLPHLLR